MSSGRHSCAEVSTLIIKLIPPHFSLNFAGSLHVLGLVAGVSVADLDQRLGRAGAEPCQLGVHLAFVREGRSVVPVKA